MTVRTDVLALKGLLGAQQLVITDLSDRLGALEQIVAALGDRLDALESPTEPPPDPPPSQGTLFGWFPGPAAYPNPGETKAQMRARCIAAFGSPPPVERIFNEQSWTVPAAGIPAIVSFAQDPVAVTRGDFDAQITAFVRALDPDTTYWLCLNHECDQPTRPYAPSEQQAGFRRFSAVVRAVGRPNVKLATILMSYTLRQSETRWLDWYPGDEYVDAIGFDAYFRPNLPKTAEDVYGRALTAARAHGKPLLICETSLGTAGAGGTGFTEDEWTRYTADAIAFLDNPDVAAVTWFCTTKADGAWTLENHRDALGLWRDAVQASTT